MAGAMRRRSWLLVGLSALCATWASEKDAKRRVAELGGKVFLEKGVVTEVLLGGRQVDDEDLAALLAFPALTDLSL